MKKLVLIITMVIATPTVANAYTGGVRGYQAPVDVFLLTWLDHAYPCRVDSSSVDASYCDKSNVYLWGSTPCEEEEDHYNSSWFGDGDCDPGNMVEYGHDGGDCDLNESLFYCNGQSSSGAVSSHEGGGLMGTTYSWDPWFSSTFGYSQYQLEYRFDRVIDEVGSCKITYAVDGVCHQHTNRGWWFSSTMPDVEEFGISGSTTSTNLYGVYGGGWADCRDDYIYQ